MRKQLFSRIFVGSVSAIFPSIVSAAAATCPPGTAAEAGVCVANTTGLPETSVTMIIGAVLGWLSFTFAAIAVIVMVVCGLMYLTAGGDDSQAEKAKSCVKWAIVGVFVAGGAWIVLKTVSQFLMGVPPIL